MPCPPGLLRALHRFSARAAAGHFAGGGAHVELDGLALRVARLDFVEAALIQLDFAYVGIDCRLQLVMDLADVQDGLRGSGRGLRRRGGGLLGLGGCAGERGGQGSGGEKRAQKAGSHHDGFSFAE